jgi:hypothetical protein
LIQKKIEFILDKPFASKQTAHTNTRAAAMGNFSIFYKVEEDKIIITAFWDNRQDPDKLLKLLETQ